MLRVGVNWRFGMRGNMNRSIAFGVAGLAMALGGYASAADLPPAPPPPPRAPAAYIPPPAPVFTWTGFYIGGNLGFGWNQGGVNDSLPPVGLGLAYGNPSASGVFFGGGQIGANYQISSFVIGAEANFDWAVNNNNSFPGVATGLGTIRVSSNDRWMTTLAARFGWAVDHLLIYGKAGGGWIGAGNFAVTNVGTGASIALSNSNTNTGWLVGLGGEYAITDHWTAKLEYDYMGLSNASYAVPAGAPFLAGDTFGSSGRSVQMLTAGVNYLFNGI
jgi:outer membrane immunogenic protein